MEKKHIIYHKPIMVTEIINNLNIEKNDIILDATAGEGGHSEILLEKYPNIKLICNDRDNIILNIAKNRLKNYKNRIDFVNSNLDKLNENIQNNSIRGIIADLGISSYHYDADKRGFSFNRNEELDMRLDKNCEYSAYDIINNFEEDKIANIIYKYGEERFSRNIAKKIIEKRKHYTIKTTTELKEIIYDAVPKKAFPKNINVSTKTFQALRIYVNQELKHIENGIYSLISLLKPGGNICILTFHSLEDRIIKNKFRELSGYKGNRDPYVEKDIGDPIIKIITKKPIIPNKKEIENNHRSRSAKLRVARKL